MALLFLLMGFVCYFIFIFIQLWQGNFGELCKPHLDGAEPRSDPLNAASSSWTIFLHLLETWDSACAKEFCRSKLAPRLHSSTHIGHGERLFWRLLKKDSTLLKSPGEPQASVKQGSDRRSGWPWSRLWWCREASCRSELMMQEELRSWRKDADRLST